MVAKRQNNELKIIESKIFSRYPEIKFGFSAKFGFGREKAPWFNLSFSVGDKEETKENRVAFLRVLGIKPEQLAWQKQIHGDKIIFVKEPGFKGESDALITNRKGIALGVFSADCTTVFIYDKQKKVIAAIHSGWRGTEKKIVIKTIQRLQKEFNSQPDDLIVFIAPAISQKNYEVGADVASKFPAKYLLKKNDKFYLDVSGINYDYLLQMKIPQENIELSPLCSYENEYLHSYRRDKEKSGRAMGVIMLN